MQIVFAGKAHPADEPAKHHLQRVFRHALDPKFGGRVAFIDDYDMHVAHYLVQGCDVWLNNPRKPLEASGTSGMKAALNGVPAPEHRRRLVGRRLQRPERLADREPDQPGRPGRHRRRGCGIALHAARERSRAGLLRAGQRGCRAAGLQVVREAMRSNMPRFSTRRMVKQYITEMYAPTAAASASAPVNRVSEAGRRSSIASPYHLRHASRISGVALFVFSVAIRASRAASSNVVIGATSVASADARYSAVVATAIADVPHLLRDSSCRACRDWCGSSDR